MKRTFFVLAFVAAAASPAAAQDRAAVCPTGNTVQQASADACELAVDLFRYMAPQFGTAIAGGNATLGQGGSMGGLGHFAVGVRANAVFGSIPQIEGAALGTSPSPDSYETANQVIPMPVIDAAFGIFKGLPLGVTSVGGIDLLLNAAYLPEFSSDQVEVTLPDGSLKVGYGARLGLLQESLVSPGLSVTYMKRDLPSVDLMGRVDGTVTVNAQDMQVETTAWRVTASKNLLAFGVAIGAGQDQYDFRGRASGSTAGVTTDEQTLDFGMKRTSYFANLNMNILLAKFVGEIGMVQGGDVATYNTFDTPADERRLYGSIGFRIGL